MAKRILIVEDDVDICLSISEFLCELGFDTAVASDGIKALKELANASPLPDVILLDLRMPHMDGWQFRECIKKHDAYSKIPVIVMSGDSAYQTVEAAAHIYKPFDVNELATKLFTTLKG